MPEQTMMADGKLAPVPDLHGTVGELYGATMAVGTIGGDTINVTIQLTDFLGNDLATRANLIAYLSDDANGDSIAGTAPNTSPAIGTDGVLGPLVTDKVFLLISESDGDIDIDITDSGADTWYLILYMPDGRLVASDAIVIA